MDKISAIRLFVRSVQLGGFTAAATENSTTQSSVSKKIAALERDVGVPLLYRSSRKQVLTEAGQKYFDFALKFLSELEQVESDLLDEQTSPSGKLTITAPVAFGQSILPPILAEFSSRYPKVRLNLQLSDQISDLLAENIDVALRAHNLEDSQLKARYLFDNRVVTVVSPEYIDKYGCPTSPEELTSHRCLLYSLSSSSHMFFKIGGEVKKVPVSVEALSNSADALLSFCLSGMGVASLPSWMVDSYIQSNRLISVLDEYYGMSLPMYAIYKKTDYTPARIRCFIDFLVKRCESSTFAKVAVNH
ncbi:LysR substrate-binding domain-containing protein [Vibrio sp. NTOU-M3]|uniref:LysR family transcriptional regulator n=1 Tax=Vibrio sp. NTOU-M3 TaxID=3234954 RepID=UPI00349F2AB4